jgi:hypothetical protein
LLGDPSIKGEHELIREDNEKFDDDLRKGRIAAETLMKPLTFFEAVEKLRLPKAIEHDDTNPKNKNKKDAVPKGGFESHQLITSIDLSGFKNLRFSKAGLQELIGGISSLPCIR